MLDLPIYFMERFEISTECVLIFFSLCCNLIMWYELSKKLYGTFYSFSQYHPMQAENNMAVRVRWLAKFAWYDVTWKHPVLRSLKYICVHVYLISSSLNVQAEFSTEINCWLHLPAGSWGSLHGAKSMHFFIDFLYPIIWATTVD